MTIIRTTKPLKKRRLHDFYETPDELCRYAISWAEQVTHTFAPGTKIVLDPGAGKGPWGYALRQHRPKAEIIGYEISDKLKNPGYYDHWYPVDYLHFVDPWIDAQMICGNPPYQQAEEFIRASYRRLCDGGVLLFLLRLSFLESAKRQRGLWKELPPQHVGVLAERISFYKNRRSDDTAYALYVWQKGGGRQGPRLHFLSWRTE